MLLILCSDCGLAADTATELIAMVRTCGSRGRLPPRPTPEDTWPEICERCLTFDVSLSLELSAPRYCLMAPAAHNKSHGC